MTTSIAQEKHVPSGASEFRLSARNCVVWTGIIGSFAGMVCGQVRMGMTDSTDLEAKQRTIAGLIQTGQTESIGKALDMLKEQFASGPSDAEKLFKSLRTLRGTLMADDNHLQQLLDVIAMAKKGRKDKGNVGYLYGMEVIIRYKQGQSDAAMKAFEQGMAKDRFENTAGEIMKFWPLVFKENAPAPSATASKDEIQEAKAKATGKKEGFAGVLRQISISTWDQDTAEEALKERILILNAMGKPEDGLVDAKMWFNVSIMPHTAQALQVLDKQLGLVDATKQAAFRQEETDGATSEKTSPTVLGIKVEGVNYEKILVKEEGTGIGQQGVGYPADELLHRGMVMLMVGKISEARKAAQGACDLKELETVGKAMDMLARCIKAEDGTIARANAWLKANPTPEGTARPKSAQKKPKSKAPTGDGAEALP